MGNLERLKRSNEDGWRPPFEAIKPLLDIAEQAEEIAASGVKDVAGLKYVEVQIDRATWAALKKALAELERLKL